MFGDELLEALWRDHASLSPHSAQIHQLLTEHGELLAYDHVALSTFDAPGLGLAALARPFEARGWRRCDHRRWHHPDPARPALALSAVAVGALSPAAQAAIARLVGQRAPRTGDAALPDRPWLPALADYEVLSAESADAAWLAAFGLRARHFAADFGSLATFPDLDALAAFLGDHGFALEPGAPGELATRAQTAVVAFSDTSARIPGFRYHVVRTHESSSSRSAETRTETLYPTDPDR